MKISNTYTKLVKIIRKLFIIYYEAQLFRPFLGSKTLGPVLGLFALVSFQRVCSKPMYFLLCIWHLSFPKKSTLFIPNIRSKQMCAQLLYCPSQRSTYTQVRLSNVFINFRVHFGPLVFQQLQIPLQFFFSKWFFNTLYCYEIISLARLHHTFTSFQFRARYYFILKTKIGFFKNNSKTKQVIGYVKFHSL